MKNILINNLLIAIYMNSKLKKDCLSFTRERMNDNEIWTPLHGICNIDSIELGAGKILLYHKSWDWLIPVIDKITSSDDYSKYIDHTCSMVDSGGIHINTKFISVTYDQVIDFINWYNFKK